MEILIQLLVPKFHLIAGQSQHVMCDWHNCDVYEFDVNCVMKPCVGSEIRNNSNRVLLRVIHEVIPTQSYGGPPILTTVLGSAAVTSEPKAYKDAVDAFLEKHCDIPDGHNADIRSWASRQLLAFHNIRAPYLDLDTN